MFRNTRTNRITKVDSLVLARTDTFYFLEFIKYTKSIFGTGTYLKTKPTVVFYTQDSEDRVIIDYSLASTEDKLYLEAFFAEMAYDTAFNLTNASFLELNTDCDVSSSLLFRSYKNNFVTAKVVSTTNKDTKKNEYSGYYFIETPQLSKSGTLQENEDTEWQGLVFSNPRTSKPLSYLGYRVGDQIEIINPNSSNNNKKLEILSYEYINGKEVLKLKSETITSENLIGQATIVNLYIKTTTNFNSSVYDNNQTNIGCCYNIEAEKYYPNHTELQCALRGSEFTFSAGSNCNTLSSSSLSSSASETLPFTLTPLTSAAEIQNKKKIVEDESRIATEFKRQLANVQPFALNAGINGVSLYTQLPKSIVQNFPDLQGLTLIADDSVYQVINLAYEAFVTDDKPVIKGVNGSTITTILLNRNILTTIYETNLTNDPDARLIFSSNQKIPVPIVDFMNYGYDYLRLGRYHLFTPVGETTQPIFVFSTTSNTASDVYISGTVTQPSVFKSII